MNAINDCVLRTYRGIQQAELLELVRGCHENGLELHMIEPTDWENYECWIDADELDVVFRRADLVEENDYAE